jgi:hypothetical protein
MLLSHTQASAPLFHGSTGFRHAALAMLTALGTMAAGQAHAHEGHGMAGSVHWHATDALGFVVAAAALVALVWWTRK